VESYKGLRNAGTYGGRRGLATLHYLSIRYPKTVNVCASEAWGAFPRDNSCGGRVRVHIDGLRQTVYRLWSWSDSLRNESCDDAPGAHSLTGIRDLMARSSRVEGLRESALLKRANGYPRRTRSVDAGPRKAAQSPVVTGCSRMTIPLKGRPSSQTDDKGQANGWSGGDHGRLSPTGMSSATTTRSPDTGSRM
jgi:hypothetical protein